jgi:uncharacterized protein YbjT (DUF2867 family)
MQRPKLLVTGATGNIGQALILTLGSHYRNKFQTIAGVHQPNDTKAIRAKVTELVDIDYDIPSTMSLALEGVNYLFLVPSHSRNRASQCKAIIKQAEEHRVQYIVLVSLLGCESRAGVFCSQFRDIEQYSSTNQDASKKAEFHSHSSNVHRCSKTCCRYKRICMQS